MIGRMIWIRLVNVRVVPHSIRSFADLLITWRVVVDMRSKFSAIHREHSPNPRKFYAFCTSVTDTATTAGIIASGTYTSAPFFITAHATSS